MRTKLVRMDNVKVGDLVRTYHTPMYGDQQAQFVFLPVVSAKYIEADGIVELRLNNGNGLQQTILYSSATEVRVADKQREPVQLRLVA